MLIERLKPNVIVRGPIPPEPVQVRVVAQAGSAVKPRTDALKRFLVDQGAGKAPQFWVLAQALAGLYPAGSQELRWVEGVLARKKGMGF